MTIVITPKSIMRFWTDFFYSLLTAPRTVANIYMLKWPGIESGSTVLVLVTCNVSWSLCRRGQLSSATKFD